MTMPLQKQVNDKKSGYIKLSRVEKFILLVGAYEDKIFKKRSELRECKLRRVCLNKDSLEEEIDAGSSTTDSSSTCALPNGEESQALSLGTFENMHSQIIENTKEFKQKLKDSIRRKSDLFKNGDLGTDKGICKLPFIEEERLLSETRKLEKELVNEMQCNSQLVQERFRKPDNMGNRGFRNNARFTSSSPNMIHKFSGTGWGCGRGKAIASPDFGDRFHAPGRIPCERVMSSSSYTANGAVAYKKASFYETPVCHEKWRVAGSGSGDQIRTLRDLKISKSSSS
ncbi:hypothetical protein ACE6H2_020155 [Prunus campanulata]